METSSRPLIRVFEKCLQVQIYVLSSQQPNQNWCSIFIFCGDDGQQEEERMNNIIIIILILLYYYMYNIMMMREEEWMMKEEGRKEGMQRWTGRTPLPPATFRSPASVYIATALASTLRAYISYCPSYESCVPVHTYSTGTPEGSSQRSKT